MIRRRPRDVLLAGAAAAAGGALATSARIRRAGRPRPLDPADAILVFGASVWPTGASLSLRVRVDRAAEVYAEGWAPTIVCSGGFSGGASEATVMRALLIERGIPPDAVIPDDGGTTTREALRSARAFSAGRWRRLIVVSSGYHIHRILREARRQGIDAIGCPALRPGPRTRQLLMFDVRQHVREVMAVPSYALGARVDALFAQPPVRPLRRAAVELRARVRSLAGEADAAADASDEILNRLRESAGALTESDSAVSPGAIELVRPVDGDVASVFGIRHRRLHAGVDYRARYGAPIRAAAAGTVVHAGPLGPYGNVTVVDHGGGIATSYAHQSGIVVAPGDRVERAQSIGFVGATGKSFGPHLHFELRVHGVPVDPLVYL